MMAFITTKKRIQIYEATYLANGLGVASPIL
jgi:hypothetical protein